MSAQSIAAQSGIGKPSKAAPFRRAATVLAHFPVMFRPVVMGIVPSFVKFYNVGILQQSPNSLNSELLQSSHVAIIPTLQYSPRCKIPGCRKSTCTQGKRSKRNFRQAGIGFPRGLLQSFHVAIIPTLQ